MGAPRYLGRVEEYLSFSGLENVVLETIVPSPAGLMCRVPVLHRTLLSPVPVLSYSSGPA